MFQDGASLTDNDSLLISLLYWTMIPTFPPIHRGCKSSRYEERDPFDEFSYSFLGGGDQTLIRVGL